MRTLIFVSVLLASISSPAQTTGQPDSLKHYSSGEVVVFPDYKKRYNTAKRLVQKVWPYALHAADLLDEINNNLLGIEKRRKVNKYCKESYENLKDEFKYVFYELYTDEGEMLMKLVHRETGLTVYEIAEKYRGKTQAEVFDALGKFFWQNVHATYDPNGEDVITEHVIMDIQSGKVPFNEEVILMDKEQYKLEQEKDREFKKENKGDIKKNEQLRKERKKQFRKDYKDSKNDRADR